MTTISPPEPVTLRQALRFWLWLGCLSFGGPAGQIALMHRELVERRRWISEARFLHALNYCMLLPGPEAQQLATYIGWLLHRTWGGVAAGALFVLPSLLLLIGLSWVYVAWGQVSWVAGLLDGIKPAVAALVLHALHRMGRKTLGDPRRNPWLWAIALGSLGALALLDVPFPLVILAAGIAGIYGARHAPLQFAPAPSHGFGSTPHAPALIDDDTPTPTHAQFRPARLAAVLAVGLLLWLVSMAILLASNGGWAEAAREQNTLAQMGWFFTKAALLTFGGAYAVLPYVYQGAVEQFQWLTGPQMMDGLALGESTPGPLIMVVAYVGFLGGWARQVLGPDQLLLGGALAACVVTWFTFLPSFIFILAGGPLVEASHGLLRYTAPLKAITAAVIGVMCSLALFFLIHVLFPGTPLGSEGHYSLSHLNWPGLLLTLAATIALVRYQIGVPTVIAACALAGLGLRLLA
jgi:chromate transporter